MARAKHAYSSRGSYQADEGWAVSVCRYEMAGMIDKQQQTFLGNPSPKFTLWRQTWAGLTKAFDFSMFPYYGVLMATCMEQT